MDPIATMAAADDRNFHFGFGRVRVIEVKDGDTVKLELDLGFNTKYTDDFRIDGIDAPEISKKATREAGLKAKAELVRILGDGSRVSVTTMKPAREKYGRWLVDPFVHGYGFVSNWMISNGYAVAYNGGKRG